MPLWDSGLPWWATSLLVVGLTLMVADIIRAIRITTLNQERLHGDQLKEAVSEIVLARLENDVETTNRDLIIIVVACCDRLSIPLRSIPLMRPVFVGILDRTIQAAASQRRDSDSVRKRLRELKGFAESFPHPGWGIYGDRLRMLIRPVWLPATETTEYLGLGAWGIALWVAALSHPLWAIGGVVWLLFFDLNIAWMMSPRPGADDQESRELLKESEILLAEVDGRVLSTAARRLNFQWD